MGLFFVLEGLDGSGKSTICKMLADRIPNSVYTASAPKDDMRKYVDSYSSNGTKFLWYMFLNADLSDKIKNGFFDKSNLFVDRYLHSTVVYHSMYVGDEIVDISLDMVKELDIVLPDYVIFLDVNTEEAFKRMKSRGDLSIYDGISLRRADELRSRYISLLEKKLFHKKEYVYVDTSNLSINEVFEEVYAKIHLLIN